MTLRHVLHSAHRCVGSLSFNAVLLLPQEVFMLQNEFQFSKKNRLNKSKCFSAKLNNGNERTTIIHALEVFHIPYTKINAYHGFSHLFLSHVATVKLQLFENDIRNIKNQDH